MISLRYKVPAPRFNESGLCQPQYLATLAEVEAIAKGNGERRLFDVREP
jgi:hypothetical protein